MTVTFVLQNKMKSPFKFRNASFWGNQALSNYIISLLSWCSSLDQIINCIVSFRVQIKIIRLCYVLDITLLLKYKYFELLSKHKGPFFCLALGPRISMGWPWARDILVEKGPVRNDDIV